MTLIRSLTVIPFVLAGYAAYENYAAYGNELPYVTNVEVAKQYCGAEWAQFASVAPYAWEEFDLRPEPSESLDSIEAITKDFSVRTKYFTSINALGSFLNAFVGFADSKNHNAVFFEQRRAEYALVSCLWPTQMDRNSMVEAEKATSTFQESENEIRVRLFRSYDMFECMQIESALEAVLAEASQKQSYDVDFATITTQTMRACDDTGRPIVDD